MQHHNSGSSPQQGLALLLALTAMIVGPVAIPATATAVPSHVSAQALHGPTASGTAVESPANATLRTTTTLAAVAIGAVVLVGLWWYLVARHRRRD